MIRLRLEYSVDVDPDSVLCGACKNQLRSDAGRIVRCDLFDLGLTMTKSGPQRLTGCLAAEQAARPWTANEDDDNPTPHHLQESER